MTNETTRQNGWPNELTIIGNNAKETGRGETPQAKGDVDYYLAGRSAIARIIASDQGWEAVPSTGDGEPMTWVNPTTGRRILNVESVWGLDNIPPQSTIYIYLRAEDAVAVPDAVKQLRRALGLHRKAGGRVEYVG